MKNKIHDLINKLNENEKQDLRSKLNASSNKNAQHYELLRKNKVSLTDAFSNSFLYKFLWQVDNENIIESMKNEKQDLISKLNASLNENAQNYDLLRKNKVSLTDAFSNSFLYKLSFTGW